MTFTITDLISVLSVGVALLALSVSFYSNRLSRKVATSDFRAVELVKSETAEIIAIFRALIMKGVVYSQQEKSKRDDKSFENYIDTKAERNGIEKFMHSSTALAYYTYIAKRSKEARESGKESEKWRAFFLKLTELRYESHPWISAKLAAELECLFEEIREKEIIEIADNLRDLPKAINLLFGEREYDTLMKVMVEPKQEAVDEDVFVDFVKFLKEVKLIDDPDLDVFWAVFTDNKELIESSHQKGANLNIRSGEIIERYKKFIDEFNESAERIA